MLNKRQRDKGFSKSKSGPVILDKVKFAFYLKKKYGFLLKPDGMWLKYSKGAFREITEREVLAIAMNEIVTDFPECYSINAEKTYLGALENLCFCKKKLNSHKNLINLKNGMFNIDTEELLPHDMKYLSTIQLNIEYDKEAECPLFKKFLMNIFAKNKKLCGVVQEIMGYCLYPDTPAHKFFLFYGTGGNGKSVLINILIALVGKGNYSTVPIRDLSRIFSRIELKDKALNISSENESMNGKRFDSQNIKAIASGDTISAEHKGKQAVNFKPFCKLIFSVNTLPSISDKSEGLMRRMVIIPFEKSYSIDDGTADIHLEEKLKAEMAGIFNLAVRGLKHLQKNDFRFTKCKKIEEYLNEFERLINPYMLFWEECIEFVEDDEDIQRTLKTDVYNEFINWANDNKYIYLAKVTQKKFWQEFKATAKKMCGSSLKEGKSNKYRYITNIRLKNEVGNCVYKYYKIRNTPVKSNTIDLSEGNSYEDDEE